MKPPSRSIKWLLVTVVAAGVGVPTAVAAWPSSFSCSAGARTVHLGEKGQTEASWDLCVPSDLRVSTFGVSHHCMTSTGAWIANFDPPAAGRNRRPKHFPADGIAVRFALDSGISEAGSDSSLPSELSEFLRTEGRRGVARLEADVVKDEHLYHLSIWLGRNVGSADERTIQAMVGSLRFVPGEPPPKGAFQSVSTSLP